MNKSMECSSNQMVSEKKNALSRNTTKKPCPANRKRPSKQKNTIKKLKGNIRDYTVEASLKKVLESPSRQSQDDNAESQINIHKDAQSEHNETKNDRGDKSQNLVTNPVNMLDDTCDVDKLLDYEPFEIENLNDAENVKIFKKKRVRQKKSNVSQSSSEQISDKSKSRTESESSNTDSKKMSETSESHTTPSDVTCMSPIDMNVDDDSHSKPSSRLSVNSDSSKNSALSLCSKTDSFRSIGSKEVKNLMEDAGKMLPPRIISRTRLSDSSMQSYSSNCTSYSTTSDIQNKLRSVSVRLERLEDNRDDLYKDFLKRMEEDKISDISPTKDNSRRAPKIFPKQQYNNPVITSHDKIFHSQHLTNPTSSFEIITNSEKTKNKKISLKRNSYDRQSVENSETMEQLKSSEDINIIFSKSTDEKNEKLDKNIIIKKEIGAIDTEDSSEPIVNKNKRKINDNFASPNKKILLENTDGIKGNDSVLYNLRQNTSKNKGKKRQNIGIKQGTSSNKTVENSSQPSQKFKFNPDFLKQPIVLGSINFKKCTPLEEIKKTDEEPKQIEFDSTINIKEEVLSSVSDHPHVTKKRQSRTKVVKDKMTQQTPVNTTSDNTKTKLNISRDLVEKVELEKRKLNKPVQGDVCVEIVPKKLKSETEKCAKKVKQSRLKKCDLETPNVIESSNDHIEKWLENLETASKDQEDIHLDEISKRPEVELTEHTEKDNVAFVEDNLSLIEILESKKIEPLPKRTKKSLNCKCCSTLEKNVETPEQFSVLPCKKNKSSTVAKNNISKAHELSTKTDVKKSVHEQEIKESVVSPVVEEKQSDMKSSKDTHLKRKRNKKSLDAKDSDNSVKQDIALKATVTSKFCEDVESCEVLNKCIASESKNLKITKVTEKPSLTSDKVTDSTIELEIKKTSASTRTSIEKKKTSSHTSEVKIPQRKVNKPKKNTNLNMKKIEPYLKKDKTNIKELLSSKNIAHNKIKLKICTELLEQHNNEIELNKQSNTESETKCPVVEGLDLTGQHLERTKLPTDTKQGEVRKRGRPRKIRNTSENCNDLRKIDEQPQTTEVNHKKSNKEVQKITEDLHKDLKSETKSSHNKHQNIKTNKNVEASSQLIIAETSKNVEIKELETPGQVVKQTVTSEFCEKAESHEDLNKCNVKSESKNLKMTKVTEISKLNTDKVTDSTTEQEVKTSVSTRTSVEKKKTSSEPMQEVKIHAPKKNTTNVRQHSRKKEKIEMKNLQGQETADTLEKHAKTTEEILIVEPCKEVKSDQEKKCTKVKSIQEQEIKKIKSQTEEPKIASPVHTKSENIEKIFDHKLKEINKQLEHILQVENTKSSRKRMFEKLIKKNKISTPAQENIKNTDSEKIIDPEEVNLDDKKVTPIKNTNNSEQSDFKIKIKESDTNVLSKNEDKCVTNLHGTDLNTTKETPEQNEDKKEYSSKKEHIPENIHPKQNLLISDQEANSLNNNIEIPTIQEAPSVQVKTNITEETTDVDQQEDTNVVVIKNENSSDSDDDTSKSHTSRFTSEKSILPKIDNQEKNINLSKNSSDDNLDSDDSLILDSKKLLKEDKVKHVFKFPTQALRPPSRHKKSIEAELVQFSLDEQLRYLETEEACTSPEQKSVLMETTEFKIPLPPSTDK